MTDNEIISRWRGECRHYWEEKSSKIFAPYQCKYCKEELVHYVDYEKQLAPEYDSDPAAWTPALYKAIEDAGLANEFAHQVLKVNATEDTRLMVHIGFMYLAATPLQKATALARAIQEGS